MSKPFAKGKDSRRAKGGYRKGSGRKPDELKEKAARIGDPLEILQFYWDVAHGKELEQIVTDAGESIAVPAPVKDRLRAGELFLDRVMGKVQQPVDVTSNGRSIVEILSEARDDA